MRQLHSTGLSLVFGLLCSTSVLAQPANDSCSMITIDPLAVGASLVYQGDNTGATITGDFAPGSSLGNFGIPVVWHAFTTTTCANVTVTFCGSTTLFIDYWNLLATTCPADDNYVVTFDYNNTDCVDGDPTMHFDALPAGTYYYPVWTQAGTAEGPYQLTISATSCGPTPPANDECSQVTPVALAVGASVPFSGDNTNATSTNDYAPGSILDGSGPAVWHAITLSECAHLSVSYCGTSPAFAMVNNVLSVNCPADNDLVFADSSNVTACVDGNYTVYFSNVAAGTYYIPVGYDVNLANGAYAMEVSATACAPVPPANDLCADAILLMVNDTADCPTNAVMGDNTNATQDAGDPSCDMTMGQYLDVWYTFNSGADTLCIVSFDAGTMGDHGLVILDACGGNELACAIAPVDSIAVSTTPNTDYWLRVYSNTDRGAGGMFSLCVSGIAPVATCEGSTVETTMAEVNVTVCSDLISDVIEFTSMSTSMEDYAYVLTTDMDEIITLLAGNSLDFNTASLGIYHVYGVSYNGNLTGITPGSPISGIGSDGDCAELSSNFVTVAVEICTGVAELANDNWSVFPNPATGSVFVVNKGADANVTMQLFDAAGRSVLHQRAQAASGGTIEVALTDVAPGLYSLRLTTREGSAVQRLMVR